MNEHTCPLCTDAYENRTDLHVHLEVHHRKSELVSHVVDSLEEAAEATVDEERPDGERQSQAI